MRDFVVIDGLVPVLVADPVERKIQAHRECVELRRGELDLSPGAAAAAGCFAESEGPLQAARTKLDATTPIDGQQSSGFSSANSSRIPPFARFSPPCEARPPPQPRTRHASATTDKAAFAGQPGGSLPGFLAAVRVASRKPQMLPRTSVPRCEVK